MRRCLTKSVFMVLKTKKFWIFRNSLILFFIFFLFVTLKVQIWSVLNFVCLVVTLEVGSRWIQWSFIFAGVERPPISWAKFQGNKTFFLFQFTEVPFIPTFSSSHFFCSFFTQITSKVKHIVAGSLLFFSLNKKQQSECCWLHKSSAMILFTFPISEFECNSVLF